VAIEEVSPMKLAAELGVRPQVIYALVRKQRVNSWQNKAGKTVVGREEVTNVLKNPQKRGPKTGKATAYDVEGTESPVRVGDVVTWRTPDGVRVSQVKSQDPPFNFLQDLWGKQVFFRNHSLAKRIADGVAKVERPVELLRMVAWQVALEKPELATELLEWVNRHKEELDAEGQADRVHEERSDSRQDDDSGSDVSSDHPRGGADAQVARAGASS
jgi:hypothetical protein